MLKNNYIPEKKRSKRAIGEYSGKIHINDSFSEPLPDSFLLSESA